MVLVAKRFKGTGDKDMKKVLVTGANGHVGYNLTKLLVEKGYQVRASVRDARNKSANAHLEKLGVEMVSADIMQPETLPNAVKGMDGVFQVAAVFTMIAKDPQKEIIDPSVIGGLNVLKAAHAAGVKKIIFTSSIAAVGCGSSAEKPFTENDWNDHCRSPYLIAKTQAEKKAWEFVKANNMHMVVINPAGVLGQGFFKHTPTTNFFELVLRGKIPAVPPFAFAYVDARDVAKAHLMAYENEKASGRYIISENHPHSMLELAQLIKEIEPSAKVPSATLPGFIMPVVPYLEMIGSALLGLPRQISPEMVADYNGAVQYFSNDKAKRELGWQPMDFKQSMTDTLSWIKQTFMNKH